MTPEELRRNIIKALREVHDPEIPVNIYDLGLIYEIAIHDGGTVTVRMTLTAPNCPVAGSLPSRVESAVAAVPGVSNARVDLVFDPPWDKSKMSEGAKLELGLTDLFSIGGKPS